MAARIRRTFRYPDDTEQEHDGREELDEEGSDISCTYMPPPYADDDHVPMKNKTDLYKSYT
jgi:hypothetical protein